MKRIVKSLILAAGAATLFAGVAAADGHLGKAVKARQSLMQIYSFNLGQLGAMAKGTVEYNSDNANAAAQNLLHAVSMNQGAMWPQGSDNGAMGDKTAALPEIWSTYPAITEKGKALITAVEGLVKVAGTDLAGLQGAIGGVGGACGSCHKTFRQKKN